ncbi:putative E3 ubiquitin-protein ligase XBAT34 isoform X2 [Wolffia australiana]
MSTREMNDAILSNHPASSISVPIFDRVSARGMGLGTSKYHLMYESVLQGDVESIRRLALSGVKLDKTLSEKTPLVLACSSPHLLDAAVELISLGANVNYHEPEANSITAIQAAAKKGLLQTVKMLLFHGGNPLIESGIERNALEIARRTGFVEIVRAIEDKICFFSGWIRFFQPTEWVVVLPGSSSIPVEIKHLNLAQYHDPCQAKPFKKIPLREWTFRKPDFSHPDPELVVIGIWLKIRAGNVGDTEQLKLFYDACHGIIRTDQHFSAASAPAGGLASTSQEDSEIETAIAVSIQTAIDEGILLSAVGFNDQGEMTGRDRLPGTTPERITDKPTSSLSSLSSSFCVICIDNCADTVCVPCGHLAGCMACLRELERKKMGCPVCRARIERILKIYPT